MEIPDDVSPGHPAYWEAFYQDRGEDSVTDWFIDAPAAVAVLRERVPAALWQQDHHHHRVLEVGCGTSELPELLLDGFDAGTHLTAVDLSETAIRFQQVKFDRNEKKRKKWGGKERKQLDFAVADACAMTMYEDDLFDLVVEKGTLDALLSSDSCHVNAERYVAEMGRVLKPGGAFAMLSLNGIDTLVATFWGDATCDWDIVVKDVVVVSKPTAANNNHSGHNEDAGVITTSGQYTVFVAVKEKRCV
eukprot:PhM_4_TR9429/c0_g1_i2/m.63304